MYIYNNQGDVLNSLYYFKLLSTRQRQGSRCLRQKIILASINGETATVGEVLASIAGKFQPNPAYVTA